MRTVKDLFDSMDREEVLKYLIDYYPDEDNNYSGYLRVWDLVRNLEPEDPNGMVCVISKVEHEEGETWYDVSGVVNEEHFAIEFTPWEEWLAMEIKTKNCELRDEEILAHILFEMTFMGFEQKDIKERLDDLVEKVDEVKKDLEIEDENKTLH